MCSFIIMAFSGLNFFDSFAKNVPKKTTVSVGTLLQTNTFSYTGSNQTITVPTGTTYVTAQLWGAGGGGAGNGGVTNVTLGSGGGGGYTSANLTVSAGTTLTIIVGQAGTVSAAGATVANTYGGGGGTQALSGDTNWKNTSGGGRSAIQISSADIITAGGGGGGGKVGYSGSTIITTGGAGGGLIGGYGNNGVSTDAFAGGGGTQSTGGSAGTTAGAGQSPTAGSQYQGGLGNQYSAGGGGGWYGGGGGSIQYPTNLYCGGGGGGSSYVSSSYLQSGTAATITQASGSTVAANTSLPAGVQGTIGGGGAGSTTGSTGQNGYVVLTFYTTNSSSNFLPSFIRGLAVWFDAADTTTITKTGNSVSQWNDKSGNGYSVVQPTSGNQPQYVANSLNGYGGIQLSNTSWLYQTGNNMPAFSSSTASSVFIVAKNDTSQPANGWDIINTFVFSSTGSLPSMAAYRYHFSFAYGATQGVGLRIGNNSVEVSVGQAGIAALGSNALIGFTISSKSAVISVNGTSTSYTGYSLQSANNSSTAFLFGDARQNSYVNNMIVYEMVGFNKQLTTYEQQKIEGYLANKWGIRSNLPSTHPYYSAGPTIPSTFNPPDIAGNFLWLDANDTATIVKSGSSVTQWIDKSSSGYNFTTSNSPTYGTMSNSKPGISFSGTQMLSNSAVAFPSVYSVFAIGYTGTNGYGRLLENDPKFFFGTGSGNTQFATFVGPTTWNDVNTNSPGTSVASLCLMELTNNNTSTGLIPYVNGTAQTAKNGSNSGFTGLNIGQYVGNSQGWGGYVAEILIYSGVLTTAQRQQVEGYLAWKWGIQTSLPVAHTYYSSAPTFTTPFYPTYVPGAILWIDAADPITITQSANLASSWYDKSGLRSDMIQGTSGSQPLYTYTSNYLPSLNFASNKWLQAASMAVPAVYTVFAVGYGNGTSYGRLLNAVNDAYLFLGADNTGAYYAFFVGNGGWTTTDANVPNYSCNTLCIMSASNAGGTTGLIPYYNGITQNTKNGTNAATTGLSVGLTYSGGSQYWNGYVCEVLIYNSVLSAANRQQIEGYLAWKWGLNTSLQTSHPYYYSIPTIPNTYFNSQTQPSTSATIYARYTGSNYSTSTTTWSDSTGNGRNIPSSQITSTGLSLVTSSNVNGATASFTTLQGTTSSFIQLTTANITNYTLFTVARYTGPTYGRIFNGTTENWLSGFWSNCNACAYHQGWITTQTNVYGNNWIISTDSSSLYRANGISYLTTTGGDTYLPPIAIGPTGQANEPSQWQVADVLIYNSYLSGSDISIVERFLATLYGITITSAPSAPTSVSATVLSSSSVSVSFTPPSGSVTSYTVTSSPGSITATGSASPITVSTLSPSTSYTFTVTATNAAGTSAASSPSGPVTTSAAVSTNTATGTYTTTTVGSYTVYTWTSGTGTFVPGANKNAYYLVVGGGGGGGGGNASGNSGPGGGSGGGVYYNNTSTTTLTGGVTYTITVGAGGTGGARTVVGGTGGTSSISGTGITTISTVGGNGGRVSASDGGGSPGAGGASVTSGSGGTTGTAVASGPGGQGYSSVASGTTGPSLTLNSGLSQVVSSGGGGGDANAGGGAGGSSGGAKDFAGSNANNSGQSATVYGCGGGGCTGDCRSLPSLVGGNGAPGVVQIWFL